MFKIDDFFKSCDIFNEILIKRFEENFKPQDDSRLWIIPAHIVFTTDNSKLHTCDARPYDFSTSPSEAETDELLITPSSVLEVFFDTENSSTRMIVVLTNGDVQIFEYRTLLYEWARIGYFNVNIVSPNTNNNHIVVTRVLLSQRQNMIYWAQKSEDSDTSFDIHRREIPLSGVREITQSSIGVPQKLLKNCPQFDIIEVRDNICIVPHLPNSINLYIIISPRSHIWLFHIEGKILWRGFISDSPMDFVTLCTKTIGLWSPTGFLKVCKLLDAVKNYAYMLYGKTLISVAPNGEIRKKVSLDITPENIQECFIMQSIVIFFMKNSASFQVYNINNGRLLQSVDLVSYSPINGTWFHSSCIPQIGFYTNKAIYKINYKPLSTLLMSEPPCTLQVPLLLKSEHVHMFSILRDVIYHNFEFCDIPPLKTMPKSLQSEALLLAVLQSCREKGFKSNDFPVKKMNDLLLENNTDLPETKLRVLLDPIVQSFKKSEKYKNSQLEVSDSE